LPSSQKSLQAHTRAINFIMYIISTPVERITRDYVPAASLALFSVFEGAFKGVEKLKREKGISGRCVGKFATSK